MAHSEIPAEKIEAYLKTVYRFGEGPEAVTLRIDQRSGARARLYASSGFACGLFVTAHNPLGRAHGIEANEANEAAHRRLATNLTALSAPAIDGAGTDPSGVWPEKRSFFALGVDRDAARNLGKRHRQDTVVWAGVDAVPKRILLR